MDSHYKYTFLLPAYKAKYFKEALLSIKNQTYTSFFCIVSDDCSPEDLKTVFDDAVGNDSRFTYQRNEKNMGSVSLVSHWNKLVNQCKTEWFIMASDDDKYFPLFLEEIDGLTTKYSKVDLFRAGVCFISENGKVLDSDKDLPEYLDALEYFKMSISKDMRSCEANYCYRKSSFIARGGYVDFPKAWCSDTATHLVMSEKGCCLTKDVLFAFRWSDLNISNNCKTPEFAKAKVKANIMFWTFIKRYAAQLVNKEYNKKDIDIIMSSYMSLIKCNIQILYLPYCNFFDFIKLHNHASRFICMNPIRTFLFWLRAHSTIVNCLVNILIKIKS